eukprot:2932181-Amphidinium_carterae.1
MVRTSVTIAVLKLSCWGAQTTKCVLRGLNNWHELSLVARVKHHSENSSRSLSGRPNIGGIDNGGISMFLSAFACASPCLLFAIGRHKL